MRAVLVEGVGEPLSIIADHPDPVLERDAEMIESPRAGSATATVLSIEQAQQAHDRLRSGQARGRIVLTT